MICIEVRDEGMGIPSEKMECIFDRFVQVDSSSQGRQKVLESVYIWPRNSPSFLEAP